MLVVARHVACNPCWRKLLPVATGWGLAVAILAGPVQSAGSQAESSASPTFEVASIKRHKPLSPDHDVCTLSNSPRKGTFYVTCVRLADLIKMAYLAPPYPTKVLGGPGWVRSDQFMWDIEAKADSATDQELLKLDPNQAMILKERMLRALLEDRFNLKVHREIRRLYSYVLVVGKKGPKFQQAKPPVSTSGGAAPAGSKRPVFSVRSQNGQTVMSGATTMPYLASFLSLQVGANVVDKTGLPGKYELNIHWSPQLRAEPPSAAPSAPEPVGPSIFGALSEQLGLKLESHKKVPASVLVIDRVELPTPN